jgi:hypothetical protein
VHHISWLPRTLVARDVAQTATLRHAHALFITVDTLIVNNVATV